VLYDIKACDHNLHRRLTGQENDLILMNARLLADKEVPMHIRLVLVPGLNDSPEELRARMQVVSELKSVQQVDLLPYHRYGAGKYTRLGLDYPLGDLPEYTDEQIAEIRVLAASFGFKVTIGG
jgi:pyruvate formate lyase activating enzyme